MSPHLVLYQLNGSCALVPHAVLLHFGIPFTLVPMRFGPEGIESVDGTLSHTDYLKIHPLGYVPALAVEDQVITENPAVLSFISSLVPEEKLFGDEGVNRARVAEWLNWLSCSLHGSGFGMLFRPGRFSDNSDHFDAIQAKGRGLITKCFSLINDRLEGKEYAVGDSLTAADFYLYIFSRWGKENGFHLETQFPHYTVLARRAESIDGVRKAVKAEGLELLYTQ